MKSIFFKLKDNYFCFNDKWVIILKVDTINKAKAEDYEYVKTEGTSITRPHFEKQTRRVLNKINSRILEFVRERDLEYLEKTQLKINFDEIL